MKDNKKLSKALRANLLRRKEFAKNDDKKTTNMTEISAKKGEKIYEGKAKILYSCENDENLLIQYFKDDATAFNNIKKDILAEKGRLNNLISEIIMQKMAENGVENHFIARINEKEQLIKKAKVIMLEVIIRNFAAGSIVKRLNLKEGSQFKKAIFEISYKNDELGDPLINEDYAVFALDLVDENQIKEIKQKALKINEILKEIFLKADIKLIDFKIEFGFDKDGKIILVDEISPDSCRLWDIKTGKKLDKDRFRQDLGGVIDAYKEVLERLK